MAGAGTQRPSTWVAIAAVAVLALGVGVLAVFAYDRANPDIPQGTAAPVPTFTLGVTTTTPTPTPTAAPPPSFARDTERFLTFGSEAMWRATAGQCGGAQPLVERSDDRGASWSDVTPRYLGIAQVASVDAFSARDAEIVAALGGCGVQALRTYTDGEFWESYPEVLAASRFVDPADPSTVHLGGGTTVAAPCGQAHGLRATGDVVTLVCDGVAYTRSGDQWMPLPGEAAAAVAVSGTDVVVAHTSADCSGLAITRFAGADPNAAFAVGCVDGVDPAAPAAIAPSDGALLVWSGDQLRAIGG